MILQTAIIEFLKYLKDKLPGWLVTFGAGYALGTERTKELQVESIEATLKEKHATAELEIEKRFKDMSSHDVIKSIVDRERAKRRPN
jgi:hypothetical protein